MTLMFLFLVVVVIALYVSFSRFLNLPHDSKEPPLIPTRIPFVGHIIGMLRDGSSYYGKIAKQHNVSIYTLRLPRSKIYVVTSPSLIAAIDRRARTISFAPYVIEFARRILIPSQRGLDDLAEDLLGEEGGVGLRPETLKAMHNSLAPGQDLETTTQVMLQSVTRQFESIFDGKEESEIALFDWVRELVTRASTDAIYGPEKNPLKDLAVYRGFWTIDKQFAFLGLNVLPDLVTPKGSRSRKLLFRALSKYYAADGHKTASRLIQSRYEVNQKYGISQSDIEHFDLSVCYGLLVNTVPGTAWALYYVYSRPHLLSELRHTVESMVRSPIAGIDNKANNQTLTISIPSIIARYPFLTSLIHEVLRVQSTNASGRIVLQDTLLDDTYLLKKDAIVLIPSAELHRSESAWGPSASAFDPARHLKLVDDDDSSGGAATAHKVTTSTYRAFGGGASVCPGRHLAMNEILAILVMMVLRFEIEPAEGRWRMPETRSHITTSILTPVEDVRVRLRERSEIKGLKWRFVWEPERESGVAGLH